jgi:hypothetical protein
MTEGTATATCAQCGTALLPGQRVDTADRSFCRTCFDGLEDQLRAHISEAQRDVPYTKAVAGGVLGGIVGVLLWWGFTVMTRISLGLVAIAIGFLVGQGVVRFSGGKRSRNLQVLSVVIALASFVVASYLVNMSFINEALAKQGDARRVGFPPGSLDAFVRVVGMNFGLMDVVFLAITLFEAWKIPRPIALPAPKIS